MLHKATTDVFAKYHVVTWDLETTGFSDASIVQIGALSASGRSFETLVNPGRKIDRRATKVHGISDHSVRYKPTFPKAWRSLVAFLREVQEADGQKPLLLVGHNSKTYDERVVREEISRHGLQKSSDHAVPPGTYSADTICAFRAAKASAHTVRNVKGDRVDLESLKLAYLYEALILDKEGMKSAHDALVDATAVMQILRQLRDLHRFLEPSTWLHPSPRRLPQPTAKTSKKRPVPGKCQEEASERPLLLVAIEASSHPSAAVETSSHSSAAVEASSRPSAAVETSSHSSAAVEASSHPSAAVETSSHPSAAVEASSQASKRRFVVTATESAVSLPVCEECRLPFSWATAHVCSADVLAAGAGGRPPQTGASLDSLRWLEIGG